ncbi:rhodanese-like domain-containing protein 4, chloroplastic isoform X2 [Tasmannia lanceolata]|uniref:rhodanese-like domain-containing protein 4, chloroplastic isoform X2 n=1 Tax=Tasmannia lanceolata TaxID=3420 RepID=UPI004064B28E
MEVLNAAGFKPFSVHKPTISSDKRAEPRKVFSFPSTPPLKFSKSTPSNACPPNLAEFLSKGFSGVLVFLSPVLHGGLARALTYEEALGLSKNTSIFENFDVDVGGFIDSVVKFGTENPLIISGGAAVLAVPLVLAQVLKDSKPWGVESASNAYLNLSEDNGAQLLDIREAKEFSEMGSPDIRSLKKKAVSVTYKGDDKAAFLKKLSLKFKEPENTTLFILDKFDGNSQLVAELATLNGFKAAFAIKDGAEGPRGWMNSGLPWIPPKRMLSVNFGDLKEAISSAFGEGSDSLPVTLGLAAATGLGVLAFAEIETVLQVLGSAALLQFVTRKVLFAEDRKRTLQQVDEFFTTKVAPTELLDEIKDDDMS